jgi:hypothetical protein
MQAYRKTGGSVFLLALAVLVLLSIRLEARPEMVKVTVNLDSTLNRMKGGIGASWHAIEDSIPLVGQISHGGSGWGANPDPSDSLRWAELRGHADWLGLDFCRVELEQRMYEPEKGKFNWEGREMRALYRILDWSESRGVDVFLQQMWGNVDWNSYPEFRGDPIKRVHGAPLSMGDFAEGLATLAGHLTRDRGYRCIRWLAINNEPGYDWSWWQTPPNESAPLAPGLKAVREALDQRGIALPLSGPDWTDTPALEPSKIDFDQYIGAYDIHSYYSRFDWMQDKTVQVDLPLSLVGRRLKDWADWAHARNKPFFLSEVGSMIYGWRGTNNGPNTFESALKDAELVVRGLNARVDGFNRWSFVNRGDLDGQWQMVDTWDIPRRRLLDKFSPKANSYFLYGLVSRFTAKHSRVAAATVEGGSIDNLPRVCAAALESPKGQLTLLVVNDAPSAWAAQFDLSGLKGKTRLYKYQVTYEERDNPGLRIDPKAEYPLDPARAGFSETLPPMSLTVYSTYKLAHADRGVTSE